MPFLLFFLYEFQIVLVLLNSNITIYHCNYHLLIQHMSCDVSHTHKTGFWYLLGVKVNVSHAHKTGFWYVLRFLWNFQTIIPVNLHGVTRDCHVTKRNTFCFCQICLKARTQGATFLVTLRATVAAQAAQAKDQKTPSRYKRYCDTFNLLFWSS